MTDLKSKLLDHEITIAEIQKQVEWRGPSGKTQGHIVITRIQALSLLTFLEKLQNELMGL